MILVHFVGDGERDAATVPHLVRGLVNKDFRSETADWHKMHLRGAGSGYARKLAFAIRQAIDAGASALVATLDEDGVSGRLNELRRARSNDAKASRLGVVLAQAVPHGEAWLLDDPVAVREALRLQRSVPVPSPTSGSPKEALHVLIALSPRAEEKVLDLLADIARGVDQQRCNHAKQTGYDDLVKDCKDYLAPLL